ncbi:hypothetical protein [Larkinella knui]|uniref:Uncharacterized protein n=1 Tax=Larkinella knui TaxID=2025310 RepID=A0A3P1CAJ4_9BACT|nr:hypothetical protein [Larkinella knui]RRB10329.1 hypothetical protein EHT87_29320 [Larkinella knui]
MLRSFYLLIVVAILLGFTSCQQLSPTDSLKSHIDGTINQFDNDIAFVASLIPFANLENQLTLPDKEHPEQITTLNDQLKQLDEHILAVEAYDQTTQGIKEEMLVLCRQAQQLTADLTQAIREGEAIEEDAADFGLLDLFDIPLKKEALEQKFGQITLRTKSLSDALRDCKLHISTYEQSLARRFRQQIRQVDSPLLFLVTKADEQELAQYAMTRLEQSIADRYQQRHRNDRNAARYTQTFSTKILANYADANLMANLQPMNGSR